MRRVNLFVTVIGFFLVQGQSMAQNSSYFLDKGKEYIECPNINGCHYIQFVPSPAIYEELISAGYQGGGYSWQGIIMGLAEMRSAKLDIIYNPEGDAFFATSNNWDAILKTESMFVELLNDNALKRQAIAKALEMNVME